MSTDKILQITSSDAETTYQIGKGIGMALRGGEIIEFVSDLGGGKTTCVKGLAFGAGVTETVQSPTFMISRVYQAEKFEIHHFDFYRLSEAGVVGDELAELIGDPAVVLAIEWGDIVHDVLPEERLKVAIQLQADGSRLLRCQASSNHHHLLAALERFA